LRAYFFSACSFLFYDVLSYFTKGTALNNTINRKGEKMGNYKKNSITLVGAVGLGTGVMISAGIFALLGQVAELSGQWFPLIFIIGSIVTGFSSYSYIKMSQEFTSGQNKKTVAKPDYHPSLATVWTSFNALCLNLNFLYRFR
jgi:hypothetical protein